MEKVTFRILNNKVDAIPFYKNEVLHLFFSDIDEVLSIDDDRIRLEYVTEITEGAVCFEEIVINNIKLPIMIKSKDQRLFNSSFKYLTGNFQNVLDETTTYVKLHKFNFRQSYSLNLTPKKALEWVLADTKFSFTGHFTIGHNSEHGFTYLVDFTVEYPVYGELQQQQGNLLESLIHRAASREKANFSALFKLPPAEKEAKINQHNPQKSEQPPKKPKQPKGKELDEDQRKLMKIIVDELSTHGKMTRAKNYAIRNLRKLKTPILYSVSGVETIVRKIRTGYYTYDPFLEVDPKSKIKG